MPPRPAAVVHQTILEETGKSAAEIFASFDEAPLGSASIGQVHRATLLDGREVAVKVTHLVEEWRKYRYIEVCVLCVCVCIHMYIY